MADGLTAKLVGSADLKRALDRLDPSQQPRAMSDALVESAGVTMRIAGREKILPGGRGKPKPKQLTSRKGGLRGSLAVGFVKRGGTITSVEAGTHLVYGAMHEKGGNFSIKSHSRTSRKGQSFRVKSHTRKVPKRAFLAPALKQAEPKFPDIFLKHIRRAAKL